MKLSIVSATGEGKTVLSAFDTALKNAGVYNYNLIRLSSVIPPNSEIVKTSSPETTGEWGDKLYVVQAEMRSATPGQSMAAGIGWYQFEDDNRGVFVEHEILEITPQQAEAKVRQLITDSLSDLCASRGFEFDLSKMNCEIISTQVQKKPSCALVLAIYKSESW